ncbi:MAG: hypothetical protein WBG18_27040, partial [Xanthobacteraceae bacterium]
KDAGQALREPRQCLPVSSVLLFFPASHIRPSKTANYFIKPLKSLSPLQRGACSKDVRRDPE